jgi:DNA (cytosine-5)-methyltransferase 1
LPTPKSHPSGPDYARINRPASGGDDLVTAVARAATDNGVSWGKYADAINHWESLTRPAPPPTVPGARGPKPRINPAFSEWMMGWPAGWVTDVEGVKRVSQLRIIGNGVVPEQAAYALQLLLEGYTG